MFTFTDAERAYLVEMRGLTTDAQGNELLVGLTLDETAEYMGFARRESPKDSGRYLALHAKYENARLSVLGAEHELRVDTPTKQ